jgi:hypothetical protein
VGPTPPTATACAAPRRPTGAVAGLGAVLLTLLTLLALFVTATPAHASVARGVVDWRLEMPEGIGDLSTVPAIVDGIGPAGLNAKWTRIYFRWARLQPQKPAAGATAEARNTYDAAYLTELDTVIAAFYARGVKVILTGTDCPEWASNQKYWVAHTYDSDIVPAIDSRPVKTAWQDLARFLAARYKGKGAQWFEVWNEPNLGSGLYPQLVGKKKTAVGPAVYLKMLKAFSISAHKGNPKAVVIAGATSRRGANNAHSTSPQWFATYLKQHGGMKYFDAYSHHPYSIPGSSPSPGARPKGATHAVTMGNIDALLRIFPKKPFYLTEYGLSTDPRDLFCVSVSQTDQARYLRQAYALAGKKRQIKVLLWFVVKDYVQDAEGSGIYSGLIGTDDVRKPAWYAFAGQAVPR